MGRTGKKVKAAGLDSRVTTGILELPSGSKTLFPISWGHFCAVLGRQEQVQLTFLSERRTQ